MAKSHAVGDAITYADGAWQEGSPALIKPRDHGFWLASAVFDGARSLAGAVPDLDRHCQRLIRSAEVMGLKSPLGADKIIALSREGIAKFPSDAELYICPMLYPTGGFITPDPTSTEFILHVGESPLPAPDGFSACVSSFRRPAPDMAPTEAKASCLYPNVARGVNEANAKGFDTGITLDPLGNVAEFSYANLFMTLDGAVHTPAINGTFLNGVTRQRIIQLLKDDGVEVHERAIGPVELANADELFATGNYAKVMPCIRYDERNLQPGPIYNRARELYFKFAETCR
jgi:branched-chain amino acid aminotransferase